MSTWRKTGYYRVVAGSKDSLVLQTAADEFGSALLSDAEHLLDNAAEHQASVFSAITRDAWLSPAWAVVTIYYWGFFSLMALGRLLGRPTWFLDRIALADLKTLSPTATVPFGAGAFAVECGSYLSATEREVHLKRGDARLHECAWRRMHAYFADTLRRQVDPGANSLEYRLFLSLRRASDLLGGEWPSMVRNVVNYRPGCGYREVLRGTQIDVLRYLRSGRRFSVEHIVDELENQLQPILSLQQELDDNPARLGRLLALTTFAFHGLAINLHSDLLDRHALDKRWADMRTRFLAHKGLVAAGACWPY